MHLRVNGVLNPRNTSTCNEEYDWFDIEREGNADTFNIGSSSARRRSFNSNEFESSTEYVTLETPETSENKYKTAVIAAGLGALAGATTAVIIINNI